MPKKQTTRRSRLSAAPRYHESLLELARRDPSDLATALRATTEAAARTLQTERVSVWWFNDGRSEIVCDDLFQLSKGTHDRGLRLQARQYPRYFRALEENRAVAADDARTDPRTSEYTEGYLIPLGITSMMDVPIWHQGRNVGIVCHEHTGPKRRWTDEEQSFAASLADMISIALGATERRRMEEELRRTEDELRQAQKMEAIGRLAGGVAHDFNNVLTAITGYGELLRHRVPPDDPSHAFAVEIVKAGTRAAALCRQLLAFSRKQVLRPVFLDLNTVVADLERMLRRLIGEDVELITEFGSDLRQVYVDRAQIEQVLLNLAVNARDAMPGGGRLRIETRSAVVADDDPRTRRGWEPGSYVELVVVDSGSGMTPEVQSHLFEPFFTTKEEGKGTGLGLSTVYGIVRQSRGHIQVASAPEEGTTFTISFPADPSPLPDETGTSEPVPVRGGTEEVLLVEDSEAVRSLARRVLEENGYRVVECVDGADALAVCSRRTDPVDLLLTDVVMPRMNGTELAERVVGMWHGTRVLYISGFVGEQFGFAGDEIEKIFLRKPFTPRELLSKVREVLDRTAVRG